MPILNIQPNQMGQSGVFPAMVFILTNDTLAKVMAPGYLNGVVQKFGIPLSEADIALVTTKASPNSPSTQVGWFSVTKTNGNWGLTATTSGSGIVLPTTANHIATYTNTLGQLSEDPATASTNGALSAGTTITAGTGITATTGNIVSTAGNVTAGGIVQGGNVQAGSNGATGQFISYPSTSNNGFLVIQAVNAGGPYVTTINTGTMGQSTAYTVPDIGATTGGIVVATSNIRMKSGSVTVPSGLTNNVITDAFCTSSSNVIGNFSSQASPASVLTITPGNGSFVVTCSAVPGNFTFNYIIIK